MDQVSEQLQMIRGSDTVPQIKTHKPGYLIRQGCHQDRRSFDQSFQTAFKKPSPFDKMMINQLPSGFWVAEHRPTGSVVASATAGIFPLAQHPIGHSLYWAFCHNSHRGTGIGQATIAAATEILADCTANYSYLSTDDFRLPAIDIYLKLGWKPLLFDAMQAQRWSNVFSNLNRKFDPSAWPVKPPQKSPN